MSLQRRFQKTIQPAEPRTWNGQRRLLTLKQAAEYLGAHLWAVRQLVRKGELPHVKIGHAFVVDVMDLDRWVDKKKIGNVA